MESDISLLEIAGEDDSLLQEITVDEDVNTTSGYFLCSPLHVPRSNPIEGMMVSEGVEGTASRSFCIDSVNKENFNLNKEEATKLSIEPQQMKRKKKGGGYNLRKSLAWDRAFFTEEGVLDPVELSMISGTVSKFNGDSLSTIQEEGTNCGSSSSDLSSFEENLFTELPVSTSGKYRNNGGGLLPKKDSSVKNNDAPTSVAKRKVLSTHDVNSSGSKRSGCPRPVESSSLKRPVNLVTTKTSAKDSKVSKLPVQKSSTSVSSKTLKSSTTGVFDSKQNQITRPAINIKKNSGLRGSNNTTSSLNKSKAGPAGKSLTTKSSLGQAKRNVASSVKCPTNLQLPVKTSSNNDLEVIPKSSLPPTVFPSTVPNGGSSKTAIPLPKSTYCAGVNMQHTQLQTAKPSGLRMPSPSLGFFGQLKAPPLQSPLKMMKFGAPPNPCFELRPPLSLQSPAVNPAICEKVESNSQVTNMQMEKTVQCDGTNYEAIQSHKELHRIFVGPEQTEKQTTSSISSMENVMLEKNDKSLLQEDTLKQLDKYDIDRTVVAVGKNSTKGSELENPQLTSHSSSAIEDTGLSVKIQDYFNAAEFENSSAFSHLGSTEPEKENYGVSSELNAGKCKVDEAFGEPVEMMHSLNCEPCLISSDSQMLWDNDADIGSKLQDCNAAEIENELNAGKCKVDEPFGEQVEMMNSLNCEPRLISSDSQMLWDNNADIGSKLQDCNAAEIENSHTLSQLRSIGQENEDSTAIDEVRKQSNVEDAGVQSLDGSIMVMGSDSNISISLTNQNKVVVNNAIEKPDFVEFPKSPFTREETLQEGVILLVDDCLLGDKSFSLGESKQETVLKSDESEGIDACESDLKGTSTPPVPVSVLDCGPNAAKVVQCRTQEDSPSPIVDSKPVVENFNLNNLFHHDIGLHDQSTSVELGNMGEDHLADETNAEDVNVTCQEVGHVSDSDLEKPYIASEPSLTVQVKSDSRISHTTEHGEEVDKFDSSEAPSLSFEHSHSLEEQQIFENENTENVNPKNNVQDGSGLESLGLSLHKDIDQAFKESEELSNMIEEQDGNSELQNPVKQVKEFSLGSVPEDEDVTRERKMSGIDKKQDILVIKPPLNATPFSDEWLAAFEAAGEEILTMKSGAVQNSPQEKSQSEPGPWSPVKRKHNQAIGPYDCTKYTNTNP